VKGLAEVTTLPYRSVDFVTAGQAYHWFDADKAKAEFKRILKPTGWTILIWNERLLDTTPFLRDYEKFLLEYGTDYKEVRHDNYERLSIEKFFASDFNRKTFANFQELDFEGLKGRLLSASYIPSEGHQCYEKMIDELKRLFARHQQDDKVKILYDTNVHYGRI
jgi:SAM-dependent methyltransferase